MLKMFGWPGLMAKPGLSSPRLSGPKSRASSLKWLFVHRLGSWTHLPSLARTCYVVLSCLRNQANIKYPLIQPKLAPWLSNEAVALDHVMCLEVEDQILRDWPLIWKFPKVKPRDERKVMHQSSQTKISCLKNLSIQSRDQGGQDMQMADVFGRTSCWSVG